jgi:hypothetical protein
LNSIKNETKGDLTAMAYGKAIELFLVNGTADSLITAELSNWNGKALKIPRIEVASCNRDDITQAGVYFLFCKEEDGCDNEKTSTKSLSAAMIKLREKYQNEGKVDNLITTEDILFSSSSAAADFVLGYSVSGPRTWKSKNGCPLKEIGDNA